MNIKEVQLKKATDEIMIKSLKKGKFPTLSSVNNYIKNKFKNNIPGLPSFKPIPAKKYECSNPQEYNHMIDSVYSDLSDLFDVDNACNNELLSAFNYYESEKNKVQSDINDIRDRIDNLLSRMSIPNSKDTMCDNFDDFSKIDFIGCSQRGIPHTDGFVDLIAKNVSNDSLTRNSKIALKDATTKFEVADKVIDNTTLSDIDNCLRDTSNETWIQRIATENDKGIITRLLIELPNTEEVTDIKYELQSSRETTIKLSIADEQKQIRNFKAVKTSSVAHWNIKKSNVKVLIFEITKTEPDGLNGINFEYYIGAKNIAISKNEYKLKSTLVSKPYKIHNPFNQVALMLEQSLPPDTMAKHFIGLDFGDSQISWERIYNKKATDLRLLDNIKANISKEISNSYGMPYKKDSHVLARLNKKPIPNSMILYIGNNMWEKKSLSIEDINNFNLKDLVVNGKLEYVKMDNTIYEQRPKTAAIYTTNVYCNEPSVVNADISIDNDNDLLVVYVNSVKIEKIDNKYIIRLSEGFNKIQVLSITGEYGADVTINAYFNEVAEVVRAKKESVREISLYDMVYNLHGASYGYFAVDDDKIIINYNPSDIGLEATVEYMYTDKTDMFDNLSIRFMSVLLSENKDVTPKIYNYKLFTI